MIISVTLTGKTIIDNDRSEITIDVDEYEVISEMGGAEKVLDMLDYSDVVAWVAKKEKEMTEDEYDRLP